MAKKIGRKRERRVRTEHSGVKIKLRILPSGRKLHLARWRDPVTGKEVERSFDALGKTTKEARREWAINKANEIKAARASLEHGARPKARTAIDDAVKDYLKSLSRKRPKTIALYGVALEHLKAWARKAGVEHVEAITPTHLTGLGNYLHALKAKVSAQGEGIGRKARVPSARLLAPATVNQFVRGIRTALRYWRRLGLASALTTDVVRDNLRFETQEKAAPNFLRPKQVRGLIEACQRHDAASYTRVGRGQASDAAQKFPYPAITPFVATLLLSGMRFTEAATLRWQDVDLEAGEIRLPASATKTREGRTVTLKESPALWSLLERMKLQAGGAVFVFGGSKPFRRDVAESARRRLIRRFGAPVFTPHDLRRTCATFSINMADANLKRASRRMGHSIVIADKLYYGIVDDLPATARTIEAAMQVDDLLPSRVAGQDNRERA